MRRCLRLVLLLLAALPTASGWTAGPVTLFSAAPASARSSYCADPEEKHLLDLINSYRADNGLEPLALSETLGGAAKHHSQSMADFNYFDPNHNLLFEGDNQDQTVTWQQNIANYGYPDNTHTSRAENLGAGYESAEEILTQWRNSPSHNDRLLSDKYQAVGIGRASNPDSEYRWYWTVTFGSLLDSPASACEGNTDGEAEPGAQLTVTGSGRNGSSTESDVAYDNDESTSWYTTKARTPVNAYIWFDLGDVYAISKIKYLFSESGAADSFEIQVSNDKNDWQPIGEGKNPKANKWKTLEWSGEARYVRFFFSNPNDDPVLGYLAEVQIFS